jgi:hypothetical protein
VVILRSAGQQSEGSSGRDIRDRVGYGSVLRVVIDNYRKRSGSNIRPAHDADHLAMGISLIAADARRRAVTCLRAELSAFLYNQSSSQGTHADC